MKTFGPAYRREIKKWGGITEDPEDQLLSPAIFKWAFRIFGIIAALMAAFFIIFLLIKLL